MTVPALPDSERLTEYAVAVASVGPLSVGFHIYCDGDDISDAALEVYDDGVKLTPETDYTVSSVAGGADLSIIARPITDAQITFTVARSGAIQILGARRPRQASQFINGVSITADQHNRRYTDLMAICREQFDKLNRAFLAPVGSLGSIISGALTGILAGPATSTPNAAARWNGGSGAGLKDSGVIIDDTNNVSGVNSLEFTEIATPSNPAANKLKVYAKDSAGTTKLYHLDSAGTETEVGSGGGVPALYFPEDEGAVGDGTTDDAAAWVAVVADVETAGCGSIWGTGDKDYYIDRTASGPSAVWHNVTGVRGFELNGRGAIMTVDRTFADDTSGWIWLFNGQQQTTIKNITTITEDGHGTNGGPKGFVHYQLNAGSEQSIFENVKGTGGYQFITNWATDGSTPPDDEPNDQIIILNCETTDVFYPVVLQGGSHHVVKNLITHNAGRSMFVTDVIGLEATVYNDGHTHDDVIFAASSDPANFGIGDTLADVKIRYVHRSESGAAVNGNCAFLSVNTDSGSPEPAFVSNFDIEFDVESVVGVAGAFGFGKRLSGVLDTTQRGHIVDGLHIHGRVVGVTNSSGITFDAMQVGDEFRRVEIGPLYGRGIAGQDFHITIDGAAFTTPLYLHDINIDGNIVLTNFAAGMVIYDNVTANNAIVGAPITGSSGSVDNAALRADGTGGRTGQASPLIIADTTGDLSRSGNGGIDIQGTNTNDDATAGQISEYIATSLTANNNANATVTLTIASPCVMTWTAHGFAVGTVTTALKLTTTGALPTGLTASTTIYMKAIDANTFNLATSADNALAGTFITTTGSQSGVHTAAVQFDLANGVVQNAAAISLGAGDWDVQGATIFGAGATTTVLNFTAALHTTSAVIGRRAGRQLGICLGGTVVGNTENNVFNVGPARFSLASTTTIYLTQQAGFGASTMTGGGWIAATRRR